MTSSRSANTPSSPRPSAHLISLSELHPPLNQGTGPSTPAGQPDAGNPLHQIKTRVSVCVGSVVLSVGDLLKAQKDQVIRLDNLVEDPVDLLIEGQVIARGMLVAMGDHFAVRITDVPVALAV